MPRPCTFRRSTVLRASIETVFSFHADPHNVQKISPSWQHATVTQADHTAVAGSEFTLTIRVFNLIPIRWHGIWRAVEHPTLLVDEALQSPFAYWCHRHEFVALDAGHTRLTDHVSYQFPGGWLGKWFGETLGRVQFHLMFADRHARTRRWANELKGPNPSAPVSPLNYS